MDGKVPVRVRVTRMADLAAIAGERPMRHEPGADPKWELDHWLRHGIRFADPDLRCDMGLETGLCRHLLAVLGTADAWGERALPAVRAMRMYRLGTWADGPRLRTLLWRMSPDGDVLGCTAMDYDAPTGWTLGEAPDHPWTRDGLLRVPWHARNADASLLDGIEPTAFFGGHLLGESQRRLWRLDGRVRVVRHELTAVLGSMAFPTVTWLAVGTWQDLVPELLALLRGRDAALLPDTPDTARAWSAMGGIRVSPRFAGEDIIEYMEGRIAGR